MSKTKSKIVEEHGIRIRLFERGGVIYRDVAVGRVVSKSGKPRTKHNVKSLRHGDWKRAEEQARALAARLALIRLSGERPGQLTIAQLHALYVTHRGGLLSAARRQEVEKAFGLFRRHVGDDFRVSDLSRHQVETYTAARLGGALRTTRGGNSGRKVRAGTIAKELGVLHAALNWAETYRKNGRPLIPSNPIRRVPLPAELNPARPVASGERYQRLLEVADRVDPQGVFRAMLQVAWYTGRRLGSIVALRACDILLTPAQVAAALAEAGREEYLAAEWPAAIRWDAEADKEGVEWIVPIPETLRSLLECYIRERALVGGALLFSARRNPGKPLPKETAYYWMRRAEELAGLPHQRRGGWHALRRAWATARKHLPLQDVMAAGGWRDPSALQRAYQHADARTVRAVMELD